MTSRRSDGAEALEAPLYFVALLLIATPSIDFITSVLPLRPSNIEWRFATVGLLSGFVLTPLLGVVLAMVVALQAGHTRFQRVIAVLNAGLAVVFSITVVLFLLDIVQLRSAVQPEARSAFQGAAAKAVLKHLTFIVALGWLARRGFLASSWSAPQAKRQVAAVVIGA